MQGELENIYRQYKQMKTNIQRSLPNPIISSENEIDVDSVEVCSKCGSFSISVDMTTNEIFCMNCGNKANKSSANKVNFKKIVEKAQEEERNRIEAAIKRGETFI